MAKKDLVRNGEIRVPDHQDDQKTASQILAASTTSITQEDFQEYVLSQIKRIIYGDHTGTWKGDFRAAHIPSLSDSVRQLINFIDQGPVEGFLGGYKEVTGVPWPTAVTWWTDNTKTKRIVDKTITRNGAQAPTLIVWRLFEEDGVTVQITATDTIVNTGSPAVFEVSRTRVVS